MGRHRPRIERWRDPVFTTYSAAQGMPPDASGPSTQPPMGASGLDRRAAACSGCATVSCTRPGRQDLADDVVYSIHGADREVWIGTQRSGVIVLRVGENSITAERFTQRQGLAQDSVFADSSQPRRRRVGGDTQRRRQRVQTCAGSSPTTHATAFHRTRSRRSSRPATAPCGSGTPNGLILFARGGKHTYTTRDGLPSNEINTLFEDRAGVSGWGRLKGSPWSRTAGSRPLARRRRSSGHRFLVSWTISAARSDPRRRQHRASQSGSPGPRRPSG